MSEIIAIGGDHAGFTYKQKLIEVLQKKGYEVKDFGPFSEGSVDYPDFIHPLCNAITSGEMKRGIIICGSGNGVAITANKHQEKMVETFLTTAFEGGRHARRVDKIPC